MEVASRDQQASVEDSTSLAPWEEQVVQDELPAIRARRAAGGCAVPADAGLTGLALSGGGIRSATFGLGVLEGLKESGLLGKFDYLSSVSGGGYIASWLSANCKRKGAGWLSSGASWKESIAHLRRYSNYLSPQLGFFSADTWTMLMVWIRNALLVQATVILGLVLALLAVRWLRIPFEAWPPSNSARWVTVVLFLIAVTGIATNLVHLHPAPSGPARGRYKYFNFNADGWAGWLLFSLSSFGLCLLIWWRTGFNPFIDGRANDQAGSMAIFLTLGAFALVPLALKLRCLRLRLKGDAYQLVSFGQGRVQQLIVLPLIVTCFLLSAVMWELASGHAGQNAISRMNSFGQLMQEAAPHWPFPIAVAFASLLVLSFCSLRHLKTPQDAAKEGPDRNRLLRYASLGAVVSAFCALALHAMFCGILLLMQGFKDDADAGVWRALVWGPPMLLTAFALTVTLQIGLMGRASLEGMREWWSRLAAWICIYAFALWAVSLAAIYGPLATAWVLDTENWAAIAAAVTWVASTIGGLFAGNSSKAGGDDKIRSAPRTATRTAINVIAVVAPYVFIVGLLLLVSAALQFLLWHGANTGGGRPTAAQFFSKHWSYLDQGERVLHWAIAGCAVAFVVLARRVDINEFSLNAFYRNRLVRCYLGATRQDERKPQHFTSFDDADDMPVGDLGAVAPGLAADGPVHLINCALNLGGSSDLNLHTRHSASFVITPYAMGSSYLKRVGNTEGYLPHDHYYRTLTLGQAVAVSGAAASPNRGFHTSPAVAILLTIFNVRLGWWFANPARKEEKFCSPRWSTLYLLLELFGLANAGSKYLMVSDGGHYENLAIYELIQRKCKLIVASDAECDREMKFEGLGTLIRMCQVDFDTEITIDVHDLALDPQTGYSRSRFAVGHIRYPDGDTGVLIYLKASMNGLTEDSSVQQYHDTHAAFPHESTGDQFYGEDQFESYRRLGKELTRDVFANGLTSEHWAELYKVWPELKLAGKGEPLRAV